MLNNYNFPDHIKGDTFVGTQFTIQVNGSPLNLTNVSIEMMLRKSETSPVALKLTKGSGITVNNAAAGIFSIDEQIIDIPSAKYLYDIEITLPNGEVKTYIGGTFKIIQDITYG